jgi:hypothetical protein
MRTSTECTLPVLLFSHLRIVKRIVLITLPIPRFNLNWLVYLKRCSLQRCLISMLLVFYIPSYVCIGFVSVTRRRMCPPGKYRYVHTSLPIIFIWIICSLCRSQHFQTDVPRMRQGNRTKRLFYIFIYSLPIIVLTVILANSVADCKIPSLDPTTKNIMAL